MDGRINREAEPAISICMYIVGKKGRSLMVMISIEGGCSTMAPKQNGKD